MKSRIPSMSQIQNIRNVKSIIFKVKNYKSRVTENNQPKNKLQNKYTVNKSSP